MSALEKNPHRYTPMSPKSPKDKKTIRGNGAESHSTHRCVVFFMGFYQNEGHKDKQWRVLEKVSVKKQPKGLVTFELMETFDRLLVVRLLSALNPCHLISLVEELEGAAHCHTVSVLLHRQQGDPHAALVAVVLSKDLAWELSTLKAQGYSSSPDASLESTMCEGDQLLLRFGGNITSVGAHNNQNDHAPERITFHSQRRNHLSVHLTEVDPFGNHSSGHYKGTATFYKVHGGELGWSGDSPHSGDSVKLLRDPICRLPFTLPKKVRNINQPVVTLVKFRQETTHSLSDSLLIWLSGQLSEEDVSQLILSLRLRRSAAQLVKLRAGNSLSAQAFHVLAMWRTGLPATPRQSNVNHLANCLAKSGRPDLARELLLRQDETTRQASVEEGRRREKI